MVVLIDVMMCADSEAEGYLFNQRYRPGIVVYTLQPPQNTRIDKVAFGFMTNEPNGTIIRLDSGIKDYMVAKLVSDSSNCCSQLGSLYTQRSDSFHDLKQLETSMNAMQIRNRNCRMYRSATTHNEN